jgi:hypothetical protein
MQKITARATPMKIRSAYHHIQLAARVRFPTY